MLEKYKDEVKNALEFIDFLSGEDKRGVAMVEAYFDESGIHFGAPLVVVAGWIGDRKTWKSFTKKWITILRKAGIQYFHSTDPKCEPLKPKLFNAIIKRDLMGMAWSVNPLVFKEIASNKYMSRFGNAYSTCAFSVAGLVSQMAKILGYTSVAIVYEDGQTNTEFISQTLTAMKAEPVDHRLGSITFINKIHPNGIPLQASDFLAHAVGTNETKWINQFIDAKKLIQPVIMEPEQLKITVRKIEVMIARYRWLRRKIRKEFKNVD
jgi:hypothetical protein